ncbi:MAG: cyclic pyranopterin monophosphate synthase MoaC [Planctomycetes bacterium]|nr:cyclic pyranopterin monophosphate synthase MoaC [Planctomycetota bacterium]
MQDSKGMVDISGKDITVRTATASGCIILGQEGFNIVKEGTCTKGDVLETAKIAAINAVKATPSIIPMCHPISIDAVKVEFATDETDKSVCVSVTVKSSGKTGVEMEALTGASTACLTIYDMLKYKGKDMVISQIKLLEKSGGKSGDYKRQD